MTPVPLRPTTCVIVAACVAVIGAPGMARAVRHVTPAARVARNTTPPRHAVRRRRHGHHRRARPRARVVLTTADLSQALATQPSVAFTARPRAGAAVIHVDPRIRHQQITGFGAAMTDSSAWLLHDELDPAQRARAMNALFGSGGIHLDFVRIPIGASDFTVDGRPYTYDDRPAGQTDPTLADFSVAHDEAYIIPTLREMLRIDPYVFTLASPWTPPPWMKANDAYDNMALGGSVLPQYYESLAQYFVAFIQAYQARGVPIDAITMMNEPRSLSSWPGSAFLPADQALWLPQYLAPALRSANLVPRIFGLDDTPLADAEMLLSSPAGADLTGTAFHCYRGMRSMSRLHHLYPDKEIVEDECSPGIIPYEPVEVAIDATRNWASGVQLWNLALDPSGGPVQQPNYGCGQCTGLITVSEQTHTAEYGLAYYQFGQISKFVVPGAVRIRSDRLVSDYRGAAGFGVTPGTDDVAFQDPDGSLVLVAYNSGASPQPLAVDAAGSYLNYTLPAGATVTFVWRPVRPSPSRTARPHRRSALLRRRRVSG